MLIPYRTLFDPETQGEGSIDPLGLATTADRLANWILPGMTARMWRPRFVTAIAVASLVVEPFGDELAADNVTPPWLVLEWYYVEALAGIREASDDLRRVPGIDKARRALRDGVPMNADRFLKTPKVFAFHGVYKRLARHVDVVDDELALGETCYRLLRTWEVEQGLSGFADRERVNGDAAKLRRTLRDAVRGGIDASQTMRRGQWPGAVFFVEHLMPHRAGRREVELLWQLLVASAAEPRGEVFRLVRDPAVRRLFRERGGERGIVDAVRSRASAGCADASTRSRHTKHSADRSWRAGTASAGSRRCVARRSSARPTWRRTCARLRSRRGCGRRSSARASGLREVPSRTNSRCSPGRSATSGRRLSCSTCSGNTIATSSGASRRTASVRGSRRPPTARWSYGRPTGWRRPGCAMTTCTRTG